MSKRVETTLKMSALAMAVAFANQVSALQSPVIEEVVVTAQKREQSIQDVPVAISAVSGAMIQEQVIKDVFDLQTSVPGLSANQSQSSTNSSFSIRGVGTSSQNYGLESSVGMYVDGVYRARQNSMINNLVDMEAVEVLRGPQGTLFGKNTPSGAILFRTKAPSHETDGFVEVNMGNYGLTNFSGAANASLIEDELAIRVTGFSSERDGFVDVEGFDTAINDRNRWGMRMQALWEPNDAFSMRIIGDYSEIDELCCAALTVKDNMFSDANPAMPGSDALLAQMGGTIYTGDQFYDMTSSLNFLPVSTNKDRGWSVEMNLDASDSLTLTSITAMRAFDAFDGIDADFTNVDLINRDNNAEQDSFSQEFRFTLEQEKMTVVGGLYYFEQSIDLEAQLHGGTMLQPFVITGQGLQPLLDGINAISAATLGAFPTAATAFPVPHTAYDMTNQDHQSWAAFGQMDYNLSDDLVLTVGLRYTDEKKDLFGSYVNLDANGDEVTFGPAPDIAGITAALGAMSVNPFDPANQMAYAQQVAAFATPGWGYYFFDPVAPRPGVDTTLADDQITGTVKLAYNVNEDVMVYALAGNGFKSGGTNTDRINAQLDLLFDAETSISYEVGMKMDLPEKGMRINSALHYTTVDDFQANSFTGSGFQLSNAGSLVSYGAELEMLWYLSETLQVTANYAWNVAEYDEFIQGVCWVATPFHTGMDDPGRMNPDDPYCDRSGGMLSNTPEHDLMLGAKKEFQISPNIMAYVGGNAVYRSEQMMDGNNDPLKMMDGYTMVNLRAGITFEEQQVDITMWGRNVTDAEYHQTNFDVTLQDGKINAYPAEPATYGVSISKRF